MSVSNEPDSNDRGDGLPDSSFALEHSTAPQYSPDPNIPQPPAVQQSSKRIKGFGPRMVVVTITTVLGIIGLAAVLSLLAGSKSSPSAENAHPVTPAPIFTSSTPAPTTISTTPAPVQPTSVSYEVSGTYSDDVPKNITIIFVNELGHDQFVRQPAPAGVGFSWTSDFVNRADANPRTAVKIITTGKTQVECSVKVNGKVVAERQGVDVLSCGRGL